MSAVGKKRIWESNMFKYGSFESEIYRAMEKKLVAKQVEDTHGLNKLARAADYLDSAAELFENAGMHSQAAEVTEVLRKLAEQLSSKAEDSKKPEKKCNCEQESCKSHKAGSCKNKADKKEAMYIGSICDSCAKTMPKKYMKNND
jgi:hypothetical protein